MTESEWLACEDPTPMLDAVRSHISDRKLRLFACYTFRRWAGREPRFQRVAVFSSAIDVAERMAERQATPDEVDRARHQLEEWMHRWNGGEVSVRGWSLCTHAVSHPVRTGDAVDALIGWRWLQQFSSVSDADIRLEESAQADVLAELVGNPFRSVRFSPDWRTDTVLTLARQMYESRDFGAMPILADALQDAGCDNDDVLNHCRGPGPHVRGCWVVDLVLGRE